MEQTNLLLLVVFILIQAYDFYSTKRIVADRGGKEMNPLLNKLFNLVGIVPGLIITKGGASLAVGWITFANIYAPMISVFLAILIVIYGVILLKNNYQAMKD